MLCPNCSKQVPDGSTFCLHCGNAISEADAVTSGPTQMGGAPVTPDEAPTSLDPPQTPDEAPTSVDPPPLTPDEAPTSAERPPTPHPLSISDSGQHGRFLPGTTVAERYRIVGLLGRGGMGEVYRADDMKLGQQVALKFLPRRVVEDQDHVERLFDEVRMARKVSHPNVCRVWDVGEADGHHYVSMEYVDGEDLASLLRRIGRLPKDKAVEIARQLCAALAAAHDEGVLHRDLKPANIMLDGRGRVKLTDFGLAAVAEVRAGTPIYMAPEQLAGEEVSIQSDLFALGLVLHELFTGKRVFEAGDFEALKRAHERSMSESLTTTADLDPAIDRVINRCLAPDPKDRPRSALAVAAGLPGADPLAAALAAGETPSPEMVAEAGGEGKLHVAFGVSLLLVALVGALVYGLRMQNSSIVAYVPFDTPPQVLDARAHEILADLGYDGQPADTAYGFVTDFNPWFWLSNDAGDAPERFEALRTGHIATAVFWWRSSPQTLVPGAGAGSPARVSYSDPPHTLPEMARLRLSGNGDLRELEVNPAFFTGNEPGGATDWSRLFELAGLDMDTFTAVEPGAAPPAFADTRVAWEGPLPGDLEATLHIEAASLAGKPVSWHVYSPWRPLEPPGEISLGLSSVGEIVFFVAFFGLMFGVMFSAIYFALRNVRLGRGDSKGAWRLARVVVAIQVLWWVLDGTHTGFNDVEYFFEQLAWGVAYGGLAWAFYLVLEPVLRRRAPTTMIGWTRLLEGRFSDPLVARDLLIGCAGGGLLAMFTVIPGALGNSTGIPMTYQNWAPLGQPLGVVVFVLSFVVFFALITFGVFLFLTALAVLLGSHWYAVGAMVGLYLVLMLVSGGAPGVSEVVTAIAVVASVLSFMVFFGLLSSTVALMTAFTIISFVVNLDFSMWYAPNVITALLLVAGLAGYGFYRSVDWNIGLPERFIEEA